MPCPCMQCSPHFYAHPVQPTVQQGQPVDPLFFVKYQEKMHKRWIKEQKAKEEEEKKKKEKPKPFYAKTFSYLEMVGILMLFSIPVAALLKTLLRTAGL